MSDSDIDYTSALEKAKEIEAQNKSEPKQDDNSDKISELEAKLKEYEEKEAAQKKAEEEARKSELDKRISELEALRIEDKKAYEQKLETLSTRQSSGAKVDPKSKLTEEEYLANQSEYDQMLIKHILENGSL